MKTFTVIVLALLLFTALAAPALAQDEPGQLPDTAVGFLDLLAGLATAWIGGGAIGSWLTNIVKKVPGIPKDDQEKIVKEWAESIAVVLTVGLGVAVQYSLPLFEYLDQAGIWPIVLAVVAATPAAFFGKLTYRLSK